MSLTLLEWSDGALPSVVRLEMSHFRGRESLLKDAATENRKYSYCKPKIIIPVELQRSDCVLRGASELVRHDKTP